MKMTTVRTFGDVCEQSYVIAAAVPVLNAGHPNRCFDRCSLLPRLAPRIRLRPLRYDLNGNLHIASADLR